MVKHLVLLLSFASISGCGLAKSLWGEGAPARETVFIQGDALPRFERIFGKDDCDASFVLKAWRNNILSSFSQIEGGHKNFITSAEVKTLVRRGLVRLHENSDESVKRALNIMELLGFKDGISKQNIEALFDWIANNRTQARTFYDLAAQGVNGTATLKGKDLVSLVHLFGSFASLTGDQILEPAHMAELIQPFIPNTFPHAKAGLQSGIELGVAFFASFCGDRVNRKVWHGNKVGECLHDVTQAFSPYAPVFDFMFGSLNPVRDRAELKSAAEKLPGEIELWLKDHHHPLFATQKISHFSDSLGIPPPYAFIRLTEWMPKLNSDSTATAFSPLFFVDLSKVLQTWILTTLEVTEHEACTVDDWKSCEFKGTYLPADQLFNEEYATLIRTKTLGYVSKIAFYDSVSGFIMSKLDNDHDGYISDQIQNLINITIRLLDTNAFAQNVVSQIQEKGVAPSNTEDSLKSLHRQGLSELAALAADLIPERAQDRRNLLQKLEAQVYAPDAVNAYSVDRLGLTSFLYVYDLVSNLRDDYLKQYQIPVRTSGSLLYVKRRTVVASLPRIFADYFPNISEDCTEWGFERSCGVLFTQVLPNPSPGLDEIETYEIDIVTLSAVLLQSMMNRCDRNGDHLLQNNLLDGFDEKHCMLSASSALAKRLMRSNIIEKDSTAELLMNLIKRVPFIRWAAKTSLSRGSTRGVWWRGLPPFTFLSGSASLGSVISLASQFMASEKVAAIDAGLIGPIDAPGDELLYHNQLSGSYPLQKRMK